MNVTELTEFVKMITDAGLAIVIAAVFIILSVKSQKDQRKWLQKFMDEKLKSSCNHPSREDTAVLDIINEKLHKELRGILNTLRADRSYIYLYHNGGVSSSGLYFQRMSCVCEVVGQGILPVAREKQNLYRASYSLLCDSLKSKNKFIVNDASSLKGQDDFIHQEFISRHAESVYIRALKDSQGNVIGFLGIDYCSINESVSESDILGLLKTVGLKVSSLVDVRDEVRGGQES